MKNKNVGFTLIEVLLAICIVGIISALILPFIITKYQNGIFDKAYKREVEIIQNSIESLVLNENKIKFEETMMYASVEPFTYTDTSEIFLKKYFRVSKFCGDNNGDCFAKVYYEYKNNDKKIYTPKYKGSCAILKNGISICITPQVGISPINGLIDLNGPKGPNVKDRDLRSFVIPSQNLKFVNRGTDNIIYSEDSGVIPEEPPSSVCSDNPEEWDETCCQQNASKITSSTHRCCVFDSLKAFDACSNEYIVYFNCSIAGPGNYPTGGRPFLSSNHFGGTLPAGYCYLDVKSVSGTTDKYVCVDFVFRGMKCYAGTDTWVNSREEFDGGSQIRGLCANSDYEPQSMLYAGLNVDPNQYGWNPGGSWVTMLKIYDGNTGDIIYHKSVSADNAAKVEEAKKLYRNFELRTNK